MDFDDFGWEELATAGALAEEIADDEIERMLIEQDSLQDDWFGTDDDQQ